MFKTHANEELSLFSQNPIGSYRSWIMLFVLLPFFHWIYSGKVLGPLRLRSIMVLNFEDFVTIMADESILTYPLRLFDVLRTTYDGYFEHDFLTYTFTVNHKRLYRVQVNCLGYLCFELWCSLGPADCFVYLNSKIKQKLFSQILKNTKQLH
jgi:hypothetical protein